MPAAATARAKDRLTVAEFDAAKKEAIQPELSPDWIILGDGPEAKRLQIRLLPIAVEQEVVELIKPHLPLLDKLEGAGVQGVGDLLETAVHVLPDIVARIFARQSITKEWLLANASSRQLVDAVMAQMEKNGLADLLGKVFRPGGPSG